MKVVFSPNIQSPVKQIIKPVKNISFGEIDGDYYSNSSFRMTKYEYEAKKDRINDKYDAQRSSLLQKADDIEMNATALWKELDRIEKLRNSELSALASEY